MSPWVKEIQYITEPTITYLGWVNKGHTLTFNNKVRDKCLERWGVIPDRNEEIVVSIFSSNGELLGKFHRIFYLNYEVNLASYFLEPEDVFVTIQYSIHSNELEMLVCKLGKTKDKFITLKKYLETIPENKIKLTFDQINAILQTKLPIFAYKYKEFWQNERTGSHDYAPSWMDTGWKVKKVDLKDQLVVFIKVN